MSNNFNDNFDLKIIKPLNKLQRSINKNVMIRLKNDIEYRGKMTNVDAYMNVILNDAEEYADGTLSANYGKVVIRGNNVLFINIKRYYDYERSTSISVGVLVDPTPIPHQRGMGYPNILKRTRDVTGFGCLMANIRSIAEEFT